MYSQSNATCAVAITQPAVRARAAARHTALLLCGLAVLGFSLTLPATRVATGQFDALILGPGRSAVAGLLAALYLGLRRDPLPARAQLRSLAIVALGAALGFPLLTALAIESVPAHHAIIVIGLTPIATSSMALWRSGERPSLAFWLFAGGGAVTVIGYGAHEHALRLERADLLLLAAVLVVALSYAEGGRLASQIDGVRVICWALVLALPVTLTCIALALVRSGLPQPSALGLLGFGYISVFSMLLCFCAWYRGLALGGVARGSQVQLLQPVLSLVWCALLLGEPLSSATWIAGGAVLVCAAGSRFTSA
jgi:drug/metabolite transporter (DMT)-like permease